MISVSIQPEARPNIWDHACSWNASHLLWKRDNYTTNSANISHLFLDHPKLLKNRYLIWRTLCMILWHFTVRINAFCW